jgi:hypothetical protein
LYVLNFGRSGYVDLLEVNMAKNQSSVLVGLFNDRNEAELAADELRAAGFAHDEIGYAIRGSDAVRGGMISDAEGTKDVKGAIEGASVGAIVGAGLAAAVTLVLPGVGPVLAAGMLAMVLGYGAAGAAVGGIFGALHGLGVSEDEAKEYEKEFHAGKAIVAVKAGNRLSEAAGILRRHGAFNLESDSLSPIPLTGPTDV